MNPETNTENRELPYPEGTAQIQMQPDGATEQYSGAQKSGAQKSEAQKPKFVMRPWTIFWSGFLLGVGIWLTLLGLGFTISPIHVLIAALAYVGSALLCVAIFMARSKSE